MKRWQMYNSIHSMKNGGFSKRQIARKLEIDFRTVNKYLSMSPEEFHNGVLKKERRQNLSLYEGVVTDWLKRHPDMTSAQVHDWLKEHYQITTAERTVRQFVARTRKKHSIPKDKGTARQYMAVEDPPMGKQMQVDIGETWVIDASKRSRTKLWFVATVLSHSRYKYGIWHARHLTAARLVQSLQSCFEHMGGMPEELVFDQDRLLSVDENYGDIIYTKEFEQFRHASGFKVYLCRGSDPESKGRTESVVKYFKGNFAKNRQIMDIDAWNSDFEDWLYRTGNKKKHGTTNKVPEEVFKQERLFLKPVPSTNKCYGETIITRTVHKDNTIFYEGNRYTLPIGTYSPNLTVSLEIKGDKLIISDPFGDYVIAEHTLSKEKGSLIINNNHKRDTSQKLDELQAALFKQLNGTDEADTLLTQIRRLKPRYARDQFALVKETAGAHNRATLEKSIHYCVTNSLFSAVELRNAAEYYKGVLQAEAEEAPQNTNIIFLNTAAAVSKKRELTEYSRIVKEGAK